MQALAAFAPGCLKDTRAVITGGGSGICRGIALAYAQLGAEVAIVGRRQEVLDQTARDIEGLTRRPVLPVAADVRDSDAMCRTMETVKQRLGGIDTLVNGAAGNFLAPAAALSPKGFRTVVDIDLFGSFHACQAAFDALCRSQRGLIINISATLHYHGTPLQVHASAAKAGVDALTKNLAVEWARFAIRVVGIAPGPVGDTEGMRRLAPGAAGASMKASVPLGRFGHIEEIAAAAVFLRSSAATYITGTTLVVDGGQSIAQPGVGLG